MPEHCRSKYRSALSELEDRCLKLENSQFSLHGVCYALALLILNWERVMLNRTLDSHPYDTARNLICNASKVVELVGLSSGFAGLGHYTDTLSTIGNMESRHQALFQDLWTAYSHEDYRARIDAYRYRIEINNLIELINGKSCIDFGCGHGNFCCALREVGAKHVIGIDFGEKSIEYAYNASKALGIDSISFIHGQVYQVNYENSSFDFAVQNGVFHHLDDEDSAYLEVYRVLKPGGYFWVYTDGIDSIQGDIQDSAARILSRFSHEHVGRVLDSFGLSVGKRYHLGDSFQATYRHTSLEDFSNRLVGYGFRVIRRLRGGFKTDTDGDALSDPWASEKFGSGDLRLLVQKI